MPYGEPPLARLHWLPFTSSVAVDAFAVMVASGTTTVGDQLVMQVAQATNIADCIKALYINGPSDVAANGYGRCTMAEVPVIALYSGTAPAAGDHCGLTANSWSLVKDRPGFVAVGAGASSKVAVVRDRANMNLWGKLDGALSQGGTATVSIWADDALADTSDNVTGKDWLLGSGESIDSGKKVKLEFICGNWYATAAQC